jgi:hypothetical protein
VQYDEARRLFCKTDHPLRLDHENNVYGSVQVPLFLGKSLALFMSSSSQFYFDTHLYFHESEPRDPSYSVAF